MRLNLIYGKHAQPDTWWQYPLRDLRVLYRSARPLAHYALAVLAVAATLGFLLALAVAA